MNRIQPDTTLSRIPEVITYACVLTQVGTSDPIVNPIVNTSNLTITWTREDVGTYKGTLETYENINLLGVATASITQSDPGKQTTIKIQLNEISIYTFNTTTSNYVDDALETAIFELKLYTTNADLS